MMANRYINTVQLISWNINGSGNPVKRRKVLAYLMSINTDIAFIEESHIMGGEQWGQSIGTVLQDGWRDRVWSCCFTGVLSLG